MDNNNHISLDALVPPEMATKAEQIGFKKAHMDPISVIVLAIVAGVFISFGAIFSTTITAGASGMLPYGVTRLLAGFTFSLGLILVIVGGAELFTGNNLIVMAWASRKVSAWQVVQNWICVYTGNFIGAISAVVAMFLGGQFLFANGAIGAAALATADAKCNLNFAQALVLGILCNNLVCLAVWLTFSARTATDRVMTIIPPVTAFVAAGFEHSIANMYFIPIGLLIKLGAPASFWTSIGKTAADFPNITLEKFLVNNLIPVTIGNIIGGSVLVGLVYWFVYLRRPKENED
ncbi:MAG: formate transporter FocA [Anaerolineales bacterium]|nr:formate transporter FocA [Anaerolineales bacterium]